MSETLITLQEYKEANSINSTEYDGRISSIILRASNYIKSYCNRTFIDHYDKLTSSFLPIVEYSNINGYFYPSEFPIQELVSVEYSIDYGTTYTPYTSISVFDRQKDAILIGADDTSSIEQANAFKITYKGGYSSTPEELKLACIDLVDFYYKNESTPRKTSNNNVVEYVMGSDLPSHIKRVLDLYRVLI